jgi:hypothetical protein
MSTNSKQSIRNKVSLLLAGATFAIGVASSASPALSQKLFRGWNCYLKSHNHPKVGEVQLIAHQTEKEAAQECESSIPACLSHGGCFAKMQ